MRTITTGESRPGRNDACYCGSGQKYKRCHGILEMARRLTKGEMADKSRQIIAHRHAQCMHPSSGAACSEKIINAHSVQRNGGLTRIALRGQVYYFRDNMGHIMGADWLLKPLLVGCKEASVFPGFCSYHDCETFKPIDNEEFSGTAEQIFLLAYRALCREVLGVQTRNDIVPLMMQMLAGKQGAELEELIKFVTQFQISADRNLRQAEREKTTFDQWLKNNDFQSLDHYIIQLDRLPDLLCSAYVQPWVDFEGNVLQQLPILDAAWQSSSFAIVATDSGGAVVLSWPANSLAAVQFAASLNRIGNDRITDAIIRFAFEYSDNVCFAPVWWDRLTVKSRDALTLRFASGCINDRTRSCLLDDGIQTADWKVKGRVSSIRF